MPISGAALRRLPSTGEGSRAIKIDPDAGVLTVKCYEPDFEASMPISGTGPAFGLNIKYLTDFISRNEVARIDGSSAGDPLTIVTEDLDMIRVIMPMRA